MKRDAEVIVVGAGPAGSATAYFLASQGHEVLLLDRAAFPRDKPCAEYLSPEAARVLDAMGVLDRLESGAVARLEGMAIRAPYSGTEALGNFQSASGYRGYRDYGLALRRTVLDSVLVAAATRAGARLEQRSYVCEVLEEQGTVTGVRVRSEGGLQGTLRASLVIGADGLRSVTARRSRLGSQGRWPRRMALVAHYEGVDGMRPLGEMHILEQGYLGVAPVGGRLANIALVLPACRMPGLPGAKAQFLEERLRAIPALARRLTRARRVGPVLAVGPFNWRARRAVRPGLALVGDAADFFDPFTGEGIFAALSGGELLAQFAHEALRTPSTSQSYMALQAYDRTRRQRFASKWKLERAIGIAVAAPSLIEFVIRALARRRQLADLLVGACGDFIPADMVLRPGYLFALLAGGLARNSVPAPPTVRAVAFSAGCETTPADPNTPVEEKQ
jgi:flavin-dependent dehydrogenase